MPPIPLLIDYPVIDPVAFSLGPVTVRWYGLAYMAGLLLGWLYIRQLLKHGRLWGGAPPMSPDQADNMLLWTTLGVVAGGRLGFVLLYEPGHFLSYPLDVFKVWQGGMAFHGGLLGVGLALWLFARSVKMPVLTAYDLAAAGVPFGLFFGRVANFINAEVYGRVTDVPWAMIFPGAGPEPRHPSQIYEGLLEGVVIFLVLAILTYRSKALQRPGLLIGTFLILYGAFRILGEIFREPDTLWFWPDAPIPAGMFYSVPMILIGLWFVVRSRAPATADG
ncbi:MAG: prolipoprotein diacylglyceryl transferase [Hyphomicrobiaceae bacterium]